MRRIYLDFNATTPVVPVAREAVVEALACIGNPSSPHQEGRAARRILEHARQSVAQVIGAAAFELVFTSGGTEADHLGLLGLVLAARAEGRAVRVLLAPGVHPALEAAAEHVRQLGFEVQGLTIDGEGRIDRGALEAALSRGFAVVACSLAQHELGTIEDVAELSRRVSEQGGWVFCDAVQALGKLPVSVAELGVAALALSSHKIGGPKGAGALWLRPGIDIGPLLGGGQQERGRRPGTESLIAIAGFGAAAEDVPARLQSAPHQAEHRRRLARGLAGLGARVLTPATENVLCNTVCAHFAGLPGELLVSSLDLQGIAISTGAACSSGLQKPSKLLLALGLTPTEALESIRISVGPTTTSDEVEVFLERLPAIVERARQFHRG